MSCSELKQITRRTVGQLKSHLVCKEILILLLRMANTGNHIKQFPKAIN